MNTLSLLDKLARLSSPQLAQVEQFIQAFASPLPSRKCECHIIDPTKTTILIFPCSDPKHSDSLIVKISGQKFIAPPRRDKNGAKYWKARDFYEVDQKEIETQTSTLEPDLVKSYQEKVEQKRPISEFSMAEIKAYSKWSTEQKQPETKEEPQSAQNQEQSELQSNESSFDKEQQVKNNHETADNKPN